MALPIKTIKQAEAEIEEGKFYTTEEFMRLSLDPGYRYELVRGVIKKLSHPGGEHMLVVDNLYGEIRNYVRARGLGRVLPPGSFDLKLDPTRSTVRSPDLTFIAKGKTIDKSAVIAIPDLAVEVYSINHRPGDYADKFEDYQKAGWDLVWLIYSPNSSPKKKANKVEVYRLRQSLQPLRVLTLGDKLDGQEVVPGFIMPVADLFEYES